MKEKRKPNPSASRLMGIVSSVTGVNINEDSRKRPVVDARQMFYKIYKDMEGWTFSDIGALFGKNHASVIHGINAIESIMLHDKNIKSMYERCRRLYFGESSEDETLTKHELIEKVSQLDGRILDLNAYIAQLEDKIKDAKMEKDVMSDLYEVIRIHTPKAKIEDAKKKVRAVLNGL